MKEGPSGDADANEYDPRALRMTNGNILQPNPDKVGAIWRRSPLDGQRTWYGTTPLYGRRSVSLAYTSWTLWRLLADGHVSPWSHTMSLSLSRPSPVDW